MQIIFVGDAFQLGPIDDNKAKGKDERTAYFFTAKAFEQLAPKVFNLTEIHRQSGEEKFASILSRFRWGVVSQEDIEYLEQSGPQQYDAKDNDNIVHLTNTRADREAHNSARLGSTVGDEITYRGIIRPKTGTRHKAVPLKLKVGSRVMTNETSLSDGQNYCKGTQGFVVRLDPAEITIRVLPDCCPPNIQVAAHIYGDVEGFPVELAHAITVHSAQGLTLTDVRVDFGKNGCFVNGQGYTALSRPKSSKQLSIARIYPCDITADPEVVRFYLRQGQKDVSPPECEEQFDRLHRIAGYTGMVTQLDNVEVFVVQHVHSWKKGNPGLQVYVVCDTGTTDEPDDTKNRRFFQSHAILVTKDKLENGDCIALSGKFCLTCCQTLDFTNARGAYYGIKKPYKNHVRWQLEPQPGATLQKQLPTNSVDQFGSVQLYESHPVAHFAQELPARVATISLSRVKLAVVDAKWTVSDEKGLTRSLKGATIPNRGYYSLT